MHSLRSLLVVAALSTLAACGGGGGGGGGSVTPPAPTPTPDPVLNTASVFYVPFYAGNTWTFNDGEKIIDGGSYSLICTCGINGHAIEDYDSYTSGGSYEGTFVLAKTGTTPETTDLIGTSTNHGSTITLIETSTLIGLSIMSDAPSVGENSTIGTFVSDITSVGGSLQLSNGQVNSVALDSVMNSGSQFAVFGFARGVGPTSLTYNGVTISLVSFSIDPVHSLNYVPGSPRVTTATGSVSITDGLKQLAHLF